MSNARQWRVVITPRAERELKSLSPREQGRIRRAIDVLAIEPRRAGVRKLRGRDNEWRLRVGDWRVRYRQDAEARVVVVLAVRHRSEAYQE